MFAKALLTLSVLLMAALPAAAAKRIALVIGNGAYVYVGALANPVNDAALMQSVLEESGFEVTRLTNLDQRAMKQAFIAFGRKLKGPKQAFSITRGTASRSKG